MGLQLFGVALLHGAEAGPVGHDATMIPFRDLAALVRAAPYARIRCDDGELAIYRRVIDAAFLHGAVLPAPCGTMFRTADQVRLWMEQNYIALSEGIHFVAGRCETRVHVTPQPMIAAEGKAMADLSATAAEAFRLLRRHAAAAVPVRGSGPEVLSAAFLLQQEQWAAFAEQVQQEAKRHPELRVEQTGPWPPYDFVRLDFGA